MRVYTHICSSQYRDAGRPKEVERDLQVVGVRRWRELVADRKKMEGHCSTGQSPQWAVVPMEEEEGEEENKKKNTHISDCLQTVYQLPLQPNNNTVQHIYTNRSGAKC
jgi:hypothetical protein